MSEITKATVSDRAKIVEFINYVFTQNGTPHDFLKLMPKCYGEDVKDLGAEHYVIKENGEIKALVANYIIDVNYSGKMLKIGLIGNVSVHTDSRGKGYMKELLSHALQEAKALGVDIMVLGGQRQRYGYFGFENGGVKLNFNISKANIRHCLSQLDCSDITFKPLSEKDIKRAKALYEKRAYHANRPAEKFLQIMRSWALECRSIYRNDQMIGYIYGNFNELVLDNEKDIAPVLKAIFQNDGLSEANIEVATFEKERIEILSAICENVNIKSVEMISVLNWKNALEALLNFKSQFTALEDGEISFQVDGKALQITVKDEKFEVKEIETAQEIEHNKLIQELFGLEVLLGGRFKNWAPLPFTLDVPDVF